MSHQMKLHLYTVAQGREFVESAFRCAESFTRLNKGVRFTVFVYNEAKPYALPNYENVDVRFVPSQCAKFFSSEYVKERPYAD